MELAIDALGKPVGIADKYAFRARLRHFAQSLAGANAATAEHLTQSMDSRSDAEFLDDVSGPAKSLFGFHSAALVPGTTTDDVQSFDGGHMGHSIRMSRHVVVSEVSPDGKRLQVAFKMTLEADQAKAMVQVIAESARKQRQLSPRELAEMREALASPPVIGATMTTTLDPSSPWPLSVSVSTLSDLDV